MMSELSSGVGVVVRRVLGHTVDVLRLDALFEKTLGDRARDRRTRHVEEADLAQLLDAVQVPAEEGNDLKEFFFVLPYDLRVLVRLSCEQKVDVLVVEVGALSRGRGPLPVEQVEQDREVHRVTREFLDVGFTALVLEAGSKRSAVLAMDATDGAPLSQVVVTLFRSQWVKREDLEQVRRWLSQFSGAWACGDDYLWRVVVDLAAAAELVDGLDDSRPDGRAADLIETVEDDKAGYPREEILDVLRGDLDAAALVSHEAGQEAFDGRLVARPLGLLRGLVVLSRVPDVDAA